MNREDIIRMTREAGLHVFGGDVIEALERFATLVAAKERNRTWTQEHWTEYERSIAAAEREACAKVCRSEAERALWNFQNDLPQNELFWNGAEQMASSCENLIRSRCKV
jgi:hypothetical protein